MSVTELDPIFGVLHANGGAAGPAEPQLPPVSEPAAALVTDHGDATATVSAPELQQPVPASQHDPDLLPVDLEHDAPHIDETEDLGGFDAVLDSAPDFDDDEPVAVVEVDYGDEPEKLEIPAAEVQPAAVGAPAAPAPAPGGVFAAFTPPIPQPRPAAAAAPLVTDTQPSAAAPRKDPAPLKLRLPALGALRPQLLRRLQACGQRHKKHMITALVLLTLVVIAAAIRPNKTSGPPTASTPAATVPAVPAASSTNRAAHKTRKAASRWTYRAVLPRHGDHARARPSTRVVIRRVAGPVPAAARAPAAGPALDAAPMGRAPATAAGSEFRP